MKRETEGDDQGEPADPAPIGYVPDLVADDLLFRKAGFGIGEKESYLVYAALKVSLAHEKFVAARSAPFAKFWGKVFGRLRDYYVIETDVEVEQPEEILESHEPRKEGANKKIYFVTHDSSASLTSLGSERLARAARRAAATHRAGPEDQVHVHGRPRGPDKHQSGLPRKGKALRRVESRS